MSFTPQQLFGLFLLGELFFSSVVASVSLVIVLVWLYTRHTAFWLRFMLSGSLLYNVLLSLVTFLSLIGLNRTNNPYAFLLFVLLVQAHFIMSNGITLFDLAVLNVIPEPAGSFQAWLNQLAINLRLRKEDPPAPPGTGTH